MVTTIVGLRDLHQIHRSSSSFTVMTFVIVVAVEPSSVVISIITVSVRVASSSATVAQETTSGRNLGFKIHCLRASASQVLPF